MQSGSIETLIQLLSKLPALGPRSARRAVLYLLKKKEVLMEPLMTALADVALTVKTCPVCGNLDTDTPCNICTDANRQKHQICVVQDVSVLSALDGIGPEDLQISSLLKRVEKGGISEVILALPATLDGQTTAHYLTDLLEKYGVIVSGLAHGVPVGGELDYLDEGTLQTAFRTRQIVKERVNG